MIVCSRSGIMMAVSLAQACDKVEFAYDKGRLQCPQGWSSTPNTPTSFILTEEIIGVCVGGGLQLPESLHCFSVCVSAVCYFSTPKKSLSWAAESKGKLYVEVRDSWKPAVYVALNLKGIP